jgi:hypothetical protein
MPTDLIRSNRSSRKGIGGSYRPGPAPVNGHQGPLPPRPGPRPGPRPPGPPAPGPEGSWGRVGARVNR